MIFPTNKFEQILKDEGHAAIAGVDEAGAGALAGPVVAAAVILPPDYAERINLRWLRDSKTVPEKRREEVYQEIMDCAVAVGVGIGEVEEIDRINIRQANYLAMKRAVDQTSADVVIVDAWTIPGITIKQVPIVKADQKSVSAAAASLVAKVTRDRMMIEFSDKYPGYEFETHKGYGTKKHREAIQQHGMSPIHRTTFCHF